MKIDKNDSTGAHAKCHFLLAMSYVSVVFLGILNFYIGYTVIKYFVGDSFSFLGGLFIAFSFIITIPALIFSWKSIHWIKEDKKHKIITAIILGILGIVSGLILHNATGLWIYILIFSILLIASALLCNTEKAETITLINDNNESLAKETIRDEKKEKKTKVQSYHVLLAFQIVEILFLFMGASGSFASDYIIVGLVFSLLFILDIILLIGYTKNIKWILSTKLIENYIFLIFTFLSFFTFVITDGKSFSKESILTLLVFSLMISLFIYQILKYKKMKKTGFFMIFSLFVYAILLTPQSAFAQNGNKMQEINLLTTNTEDYVGFYSTDIDDFYHPEKSSRYPSINLFDGTFNTCWLAGSYKRNNYNTLYVRLPKEIDLNKIILNIFSGYGKNKTLYYQNARPKKIKISIYVAYNPKGYSTEVVDKYFIKKYSEKSIELKDTFGVQSFPLNLNKQKLIDFQKKNLNNCKSFVEDKDIKITERAFILKVEIISAYNGTKYDDVCISEMFFNNRFVTPYPLKFNEVKNVYIKNDNTLLADYANEKAVVIYKDTSSVFTMIDWVQNANYAILHYVPNDVAGTNARIEELYSMIDLRSRKVVDREFKKCNGHTPMFGILKKEDGRYYIENIEKYDIELK